MDKKPSGLAKANTQPFYTFKNRFRSSEGGKAKAAWGTSTRPPPSASIPPAALSPPPALAPGQGQFCSSLARLGMFFRIALGQSSPQPSSLFLQGECKTKQELPRFLGFRSFSEVQQRGRSLAADPEVLSDYAG